MISVDFIQLASNNISTFYKKNSVQVSHTMTTVASGRTVRMPKDDIGNFMRSERIGRENGDYRTIQRDISEGLAILDIAENVGQEIFNSVNRMQELSDLYWEPGTSSEDRVLFEQEFNNIRTNVTTLIANSRYRDRQLVTDTSANPLFSFAVNPGNFTDTFDISFGGSLIPDVSALTLSGPDQATVNSAIDEQYGRIGRYLGKLAGMRGGLNALYEIGAKKITENEAVDTSISKVQDMDEVATLIEHSMRQDSSVAMMAQANATRFSILSLIQTNN